MSGQGSTPAVVKNLAVADKIDSDSPVFGREFVARVVAWVRVGEDLGVIDLRAAMSLAQRACMPLPLRVMMCDVSKSKFAVMAEISQAKSSASRSVFDSTA